MKTQDTLIVAPQLGTVPADAQDAMDKAQAEAASQPAEKPRGPTMFVLVRADEGKGIEMANGEKWFAGTPLRAACGEWLKLKRDVAIKLASGLKQKHDGLQVRVVPDFVFRRERRERDAATTDEAAGLMKTLFGHGGKGATDPTGPKHPSPMAAAMAAANGGKPVEPARFGQPSAKPKKGGNGKKGGRRDGKSHRHDTSEAEAA